MHPPLRPAPLWLASMLLLLPVVATAAPFCIQISGQTPQCLYVDPAECAAHAGQLGGACVPNKATLKTPPGPGQFCLVNSDRTMQCLYPDYASCAATAQGHQEACMAATLKPPDVTPLMRQNPLNGPE